MKREEEPPFADAALQARLEAFARGRSDGATLLPWAERLDPRDRERLREDLAVVLAEPESTGEPLDWREIGEILQEWAENAEWEEVVLRPEKADGDGTFRIDLRPQDLETLTRASAAVRKATERLLAEFLPFYPTVGFFLPRGRLRKMRDRDLWQLRLPDGYRLRYVVDKAGRVVHVVYLGPHPDRDARDREQAIRSRAKQPRSDRE